MDTADLNGKRIVVVEDDYLLATDICRQLRDLGATVLGPAPTPFYAEQLIGKRHIHAAILDIGLHGVPVFSVADMLKSRGVPILFATSYERDALPPRFREANLLEKPLDRAKLVSNLVEMTRRPAVPLPELKPILSGSSAHDAPAMQFARALARRLQPATAAVRH